MKGARTLLLACAALTVPHGFAHAQTAASAGADTSSDQLEDIVVTAQRRAERLQDVPVAITALTSAQIASRGVLEFQDLGKAVPSFQTGVQGFSSLGFLRGVGSTAANVGMEPPIAMFVDDVYLPSGTASTFDFNSIDSVEVLKGPQGTLFGRNATGGVVHVKTRNPTQDLAAEGEVGYDNFETLTAKAYFNVGLADGIAANVAAYRIDQNQGWGRNIVTGGEAFRKEAWGIRAKLSLDPTEALNILLTGMYGHRKTDQGLALRQAPGFRGFGGYNADAAGAGFWDQTSDSPDPVRTTNKLASAKASYDAGPVQLVSITSYQTVHTLPVIDSDATPTPLVRVDGDMGGKTFTQEIQALSQPGSPVSWIFGGFYMWDKSRYQVTITGAAAPGAPQFAQSYETTKSYSGFAQSSFEILPKTRMTLGLRYTSDKRALDGRARNATVAFGPFAAHDTFNSVTGRFVIDYHINDDVMTYAGFNRGFKSGIFNISAIGVGSTAAPAPVEPEDLDAYTVGFKGDFLDRRLRINAEAYLYKYNNLQTQNVNSNGTTVLLNGGKATIKGFDLDVTAIPVSNLTLTASIGVAHGKYDEFNNGLVFFPLAPNARIPIPAGCAATTPTYPTGGTPAAQRACNLAGNKTIQTPPFTSMLSADYRIPSSVGDFNLNVSWTHGGDFFWEAGNMPYSKQPKTDVVAASLSWRSTDERFGIRVYGRNLTNDKYYGYAAAATLAGFKYSPAEPRTYGVSLSVKY